MDWLMEPIYDGISWVLLMWHSLWDMLLPGDGRFLGTNWEWVLAIVFLVVTVRLVLFPIFVKQIKSQRAMQALAPKIRELQVKHKGDQQTLREEMMKLYQTEKVNPLMGCLPMFLQIPVFFGLFHVLKSRDPLGFEPYTDRPKTLYGWSVDQFDSAAGAQLFTAPIPASFTTNAERLLFLGGAHPAAAKIVAAVLVIIMMLTTFMTSRQMIMKTGWQQEPQQRLIQKLMLYGIPLSLLLGGWAFPIGVIIYWVTQNILSLGQQQWVLRKYPPLITAPQQTPKSARERAAVAAKKEPGAVARFFLVLPPPAKPAGSAVTPASRRGWLGKLSGKGGWLGRIAERGETTPPAPEPGPRSQAPRPGAKPRPAVSSPPEARTDAHEVTEPAEALTADEPPVPRAATKAGPAATTKPSASKPAPAARSGQPPRASGGPKATGTQRRASPPATTPAAKPPAGSVSPNGVAGADAGAVTGNGAGAGATGSPAGGSAAQPATSNGKARSAGPARAATRKATPPRKGGQSGRKGGRR